MSTNSIGPGGLTIQGFSDIVNELLNGADGYPGLLQIYGPGLSLNPNSPDMEMVDIYAQAKLDTLQQLQNIYDSMDPDQATGTVLDQRCAINGVFREQGTYTQQYVSVTTTAALTLPGLDLNPPASAFTVQDGQGNQYVLVTTYSFLSPGTQTLLFQGVNLGPVTSAPNTITVPVTILPNVTAVNNPTGPSTVGVNEETDVALRIRRANSVALPSQGWYQGLYAALLDIDGVTNALVLENRTNATDVNGIPGHSIWCLVTIGASDVATVENEIAEVINIDRNAGCGMKGSVSIPIAQPAGPPVDILFDLATKVPIWFEAQVAPITGNVDLAYIASQILSTFGSSYGINQAADASSIVAFIKTLYPNCYVTGEGVSLNGTNWYPLITPAAVNDQFAFTGSSYISITA
jgi:uncharacterized phage protein gp47/JayE